jgi:predicted nucleic acid-binding protein
LSSYYVDTSALSKRYVNEIGSDWIHSLIRPVTGNLIVVCEITSVEGFSVFARLRRENRLTSTRHTRLQAQLLLHIEREYLVVPMEGSMLAQARRLLNRYPLRALDAIQLASAQHAATILGEALTFVSSDKVLLSAAHSEGFAIDDPNAHP